MRKQQRLVVLTTIIVLIIGFVLYSSREENPPEELITAEESPFTSSNTPESSNTENAVTKEGENKGPLLVDVKGAVHRPGIYKMDHGERVADAIEKAGGFVEKADKDLINLAQKVQDEMVISIPKEGEVVEGGFEMSSGSVQSKDDHQTTNSVNINTADQSELETLPGVGPSKAQAIIKHREENGPFDSAEAITDVTGIGEKTFENMKDAIQVH